MQSGTSLLAQRTAGMHGEVFGVEANSNFELWLALNPMPSPKISMSTYSFPSTKFKIITAKAGLHLGINVVHVRVGGRGRRKAGSGVALKDQGGDDLAEGEDAAGGDEEGEEGGDGGEGDGGADDKADDGAGDLNPRSPELEDEGGAQEGVNAEATAAGFDASYDTAGDGLDEDFRLAMKQVKSQDILCQSSPHLIVLFITGPTVTQWTNDLRFQLRSPCPTTDPDRRGSVGSRRLERSGRLLLEALLHVDDHEGRRSRGRQRRRPSRRHRFAHPHRPVSPRLYCPRRPVRQQLPGIGKEAVEGEDVMYK